MSTMLSAKSVVIVTFLTLGLLFSGMFAYYLMNLDTTPQETGTSYYSESVTIIVEGKKQLNYTLMLPAIYTGDDITPSMVKTQQYNHNIDETSLQIQWIEVNNSMFLEIAVNNTQRLELNQTVELPDIEGGIIAYEDLLFSHKLGRSNSTVIILAADSSINLSYTVSGKTNLCQGDIGLSRSDVQPGTTEIDTSRHKGVYACA